MSFQSKKLSHEHEAEVFDLITEHYSKDFYFNWLGLKGQDIDHYNIIRAKMKLKQDWSVGIFNKETNKLVAVSLNVVQRKGETLDPEVQDFAYEETYLSDELQEIVELFAELEANIFDLLQVDQIFYAGMETVHPNFRKRGISYKLYQESESFARESGCKYIVASPTNEYICKSFLKKNYRVLKEINYTDFYLKTKAKVFSKVTYPYVKTQLVYKNILDSTI